MVYEGLFDPAAGPSLITRDALAGRQWEAHLRERSPEPDASAWLAPKILSLRAWQRERWSRHAHDPRLMLTAEQSDALWREVIDESPLAEGLLDVGSCARWSLDARTLLKEWNVEPAGIGTRYSEPDFRAFLEWSQSFEARLETSGWIDEAGAAAWLAERDSGPPESLVLVELDEATPAFAAGLQARAARGWRIERLQAPRAGSRAHRIELPSPEAELETAVRWACNALARDPTQRIALVIADLGRRTEQIRRALGSALGTAHPYALKRSEPARADAAIGAALGGLELLTGRASSATLSRWLRSPFFQGGDARRRASAARLDAALRGWVSARLPFLEAYRAAGLRAQIERFDAELSARLDAALGVLERGPRRTTTAQWAQLLRLALRRLGWPAPGSPVEDGALRAWEDAFGRFAALTAILGDVRLERAILELERILSLRPAMPVWPLRGVHVLEHVDDIGPGYSAAWVTGMTDLAWPERARANPLLPRRLQIQAGLPWATPEDATRRARTSTARLLERVPEVVASWPAQVYDFASDPSPLIEGLEPVAMRELGLGPSLPTRARARSLELIDDAAPGYALERIPGGARTLNQQARCPLRAFCETRLGAHELNPIGRGLDRRMQGIAVHRALEVFMRAHPSRRAIDALRERLRAEVRAAATRALGEIFGSALASLRVLFELEVARITALLVALCELELERTEFTTTQIEERTRLDIGGHTIASRVDRVDELGDGTRVIIDYKTGRSISFADWFRPRLGDTQLPLYALQSSEKLAALAIVALAGPEPAFRVLVASADVWPGARTLPDGASWSDQIERWRQQIVELVQEYAKGDTRIFIDDYADAAGAYAPLTRIHAVLRDNAITEPEE